MKIDLKKLWDDKKGYVISALLVPLSTAYYFSKDVVVDYMDRQNEIEFKANLKKAAKDTAVTNSLLSNETFVKSFLNNEYVQNFVKEAGDGLSKDIHNKVVEDITKKDSTKVNQNAYLAKELNIHPSSVDGLVLQMLSDYTTGKLATKEDIKEATGPGRNPNTASY